MASLGARRKIAIVGLGYVGLPVAVSFAEAGFDVIGFDIDRRRIEELQGGYDRTRELDINDFAIPGLTLTTDEALLRHADFFIVTVPTPIDAACTPDLSMLLGASRTVGSALKKGDIVVYESTVYPGATEEDCAPVLEAISGLHCGTDFTVAFSPERINPGDRTHRFRDIVKVVSGQDRQTLQVVAETYATVVKAGVYCAPSIKVAEAAKVIENTQRDLNIALVNELAVIFGRMGIDTRDVLAAAGSKWNFLQFSPGLVGGHCIGVDPYYLTYKAQRLGYHPQVVLAGRRVNDEIASYVTRECVRRLVRIGRGAPVVTILGVTFKENVPDVRNTKVINIAHELEGFGIQVQIADPEAQSDDVAREYGRELSRLVDLSPADAVIFAVPHRQFIAGGWTMVERLLRNGVGPVLDIKGVLDRDSVPAGIDLWRL